MTKVAQQKEILDKLTQMVQKKHEGNMAKQSSDNDNNDVTSDESSNKQANAPMATGVPGKDTAIASVSSKHDNVDKNNVGADGLAPQKHEQHASTDPSKPVAKAANDDNVNVNPDLNKLGEDIRMLIDKLSESKATGVPGKDTAIASVSSKHDNVDKNNVGADGLAPQKHEQHASTDPSKPVAKAAGDLTEEEANKIASYELGKQLVDTFVKQAEQNQNELMKQAGARDFEELVNYASLALQNNKTASNGIQDTNILEKEAEEAGAQYFQSLYKEAAIEEIVTEYKAQATKLAALQKENEDLKKQANDLNLVKLELEKKAAADEEARKYAALAEYTANSVLEKLRSEMLANASNR